MKRGGCLNFGGFPAGDCEFSDLNFNSGARKLLQPGGRHPGKK